MHAPRSRHVRFSGAGGRVVTGDSGEQLRRGGAQAAAPERLRTVMAEAMTNTHDAGHHARGTTQRPPGELRDRS